MCQFVPIPPDLNFLSLYIALICFVHFGVFKMNAIDPDEGPDAKSENKCEKTKQLYCQAKYGKALAAHSSRLDGDDPFIALQRDSAVNTIKTIRANLKEHTSDEVTDSCDQNDSGLKSIYDGQLHQLENLISFQRAAREKMRNQLIEIEKKYIKTHSDLDEERQKHEREAAHGDDIVVKLEKEKERLKSEVEYERSLNRKLEKDLMHAIQDWEEQRQLALRQRQAAAFIIKQKHVLAQELALERQRVALLQQKLLSSSPIRDPLLSAGSEKEKTDKDISSKNDISEVESYKQIYNENDATQRISNSSLSQECEKLRSRLAKEVDLRESLENDLERLRRLHQLPPPLYSDTGDQFSLSPSTHEKPSSSLSVTEVGSSAQHEVSTNSTPLISASSSNSSQTSYSSIALKAPRPPEPPVRRTPEMMSLTKIHRSRSKSPSALTALSNNTPIGISQDKEKDFSTSNSNSEFQPLTQSSPTLHYNLTRSSGRMVVVRSRSRSSTPSPPPPPPPVQLHYPYPGMQSHPGTSPSTPSSPSLGVQCNHNSLAGTSKLMMGGSGIGGLTSRVSLGLNSHSSRSATSGSLNSSRLHSHHSNHHQQHHHHQLYQPFSMGLVTSGTVAPGVNSMSPSSPTVASNSRNACFGRRLAGVGGSGASPAVTVSGILVPRAPFLSTSPQSPGDANAIIIPPSGPNIGGITLAGGYFNPRLNQTPRDGLSQFISHLGHPQNVHKSQQQPTPAPKSSQHPHQQHSSQINPSIHHPLLPHLTSHPLSGSPVLSSSPRTPGLYLSPGPTISSSLSPAPASSTSTVPNTPPLCGVASLSSKLYHASAGVRVADSSTSGTITAPLLVNNRGVSAQNSSSHLCINGK
ncbi:unnamed protein product [Protopolystoma xenopodis]|uniref:Cortactin-binding protein-2 N-terminal domain-containing protein n=1 Tax=Protopolystoma xenopodis TaxID=117903 RepID=A0A3S4ZN27_9PLAT|nr:unnamed protein product [Protopolystoma xenopodis]